jgi:hypothetical protein
MRRPFKRRELPPTDDSGDFAYFIHPTDITLPKTGKSGDTRRSPETQDFDQEMRCPA